MYVLDHSFTSAGLNSLIEPSATVKILLLKSVSEKIRFILSMSVSVTST